MAILEYLAFSSVWVAAAAAALCAAAGRAAGAATDGSTLVLAAAGTLVVYIVDRLRDSENDRLTSPRRTAFVDRWRPVLVVLASVSAATAALLAWRAGPVVLFVLAPVAALGLLHRRLKRFVWWKPLYVGGAWTAVAVGLPAAARGGADLVRLAWVAAVVAATVLANAVASNLRDDEAPSARFGPRVPLRLSRGLAGAALLLALLAPEGVRPLAFLPLATLAALVSFHAGELYGLVTVDGALLLGALAAVWVG